MGYKYGSAPNVLCRLVETCTNLQLVATNPAHIVLDDMLVSTNQGLQVLGAPSINAKKQGLLAWNTPNLQVLERIAFPPDAPLQVWYHITAPTDGWIVARFGDADFIVGGDLCSNRPAPTLLTFEYDRVAAAAYAINQSYKNDNIDVNTVSMNGRVSTRIWNLPFANFNYGTAVQHRGVGATGSAVFISEIIWIGGFPMTVAGSADFWEGCNGETSANPSTSTWRYCANLPDLTPPEPLATINWRLHGGIVSYFIDKNDVLSSKVFLSQANALAITKGVFLGVATLNNTASKFLSQNGITLFTLNGSHVNDYMAISSGGKIRLEKETFTLSLRNSLSDLKAGDYIWINSGPSSSGSIGAGNSNSDFHGFIVLGWGEMLTCEDALSRQFTLGATYGPGIIVPEESMIPFENSIYIVPYVADFAGLPGKVVGNNTSYIIQRPIPRPFYCSAYASPSFFSSGHSWWFFGLPSQITLDPNMLYTDTLWIWTGSDGDIPLP